MGYGEKKQHVAVCLCQCLFRINWKHLCVRRHKLHATRHQRNEMFSTFLPFIFHVQIFHSFSPSSTVAWFRCGLIFIIIIALNRVARVCLEIVQCVFVCVCVLRNGCLFSASGQHASIVNECDNTRSGTVKMRNSSIPEDTEHILQWCEANKNHSSSSTNKKNCNKIHGVAAAAALNRERGKQLLIMMCDTIENVHW